MLVKVLFYEARDPNPDSQWPPELTALIRFARPERAVACAECGKATKKLWTMLVPFQAAVGDFLVLSKGADRPALALVCDEHPIFPTEPFAAAALRGVGNAEVPEGEPPDEDEDEEGDGGPDDGDEGGDGGEEEDDDHAG